MKILYDTFTGNVGRFVSKLPVDATQITPAMTVDEDFVLVTFSTGFGEVPETTHEFVKKNAPYFKGVACSGNKNWRDKYGACGDILAELYHVPILHKFEMSGTPQDVDLFMEGLNKIASY